MGGGDLLNLLIERDTFPEDFTRFYVAEVRIPLLEQHPALIFFFFAPLDGIGHRVMPHIWFHSP